ncbi:hypothetical protein C8Q78DRAFT_1023353 [Trametes maxima]|nr:hypothetical protein C8Q78DRAFT_1023353 [Trametes maxima]
MDFLGLLHASLKMLLASEAVAGTKMLTKIILNNLCKVSSAFVPTNGRHNIRLSLGTLPVDVTPRCFWNLI